MNIAAGHTLSDESRRRCSAIGVNSYLPLRAAKIPRLLSARSRR